LTWDPYLDLGSGVLHNRLGLTDRARLRAAEAEFATLRLAQLHLDPLAGDFDLPHLCAIHRAVLGDVYDWAGELRTVSLGRGALYCLPHRLVPYAGEVFGRLTRARRLRCRSRAPFVDGLTRLFAELHYLHPFREGSGLAQRAFLGQLAVAAGHPVRWAAMDPAEHAAAARAAHLARDTVPLRALLDRLVVS